MKIKNHNDVGGGDRGFCKGIREGANVILVIMALALSPLAYGMPSEQKLKEVKPLVDSLIADDMQAMKAKKKSPKDVAVALVAFADKAESEAGKFLLLHKAFYVSARGNIDDYAAYVLNRIRNEIADVSAEYIVDLVSKEIRNISAVKSPKVFAIYSEAKRTVDLRRRLATIVSRLRKEPDDKALLRQQAEILAALGNWTRALEIYAKIGSKAARYEIDPQSVEGYDLLNAADFWWNYKANDDEPFKAHAAALYRVALDKDVATGLRREMALKRIKEAESFCSNSAPTSIKGESDKVVVAEKPKGVCKTGDTKTITLPGGAKMELIYCAPGLFLMGNPRKGGQQVTISKGFWLGKYEVSQAQWKSVMGDNPSHFKGNDKPVDSVTWDDCQSFIKKVNNSLKCESRLPTEAEWEYACRAGTTWDYGGTGQLDGMGWYDGNSGQTTHSIGKKSANSWGFYDMHGNVWEWCFDWEGPLMYGTDPNGPPSGSRRVLRGGSWSYNADCSKSFNRGRNFPNAVREDFGFRLCMSAE
jgi:formylglycine-generating enzyme required for sulfatase activity